MTMARLLRGLVLTLAGVAFATAAGAVDMTGTWEGRERCHCFNEVDGKFTEKYRDQVMEITQDGTDLNIEAYGELFNGNVIGHPRSNSKGEASLIACDTDPTDNASFGEIGRAKVSARANGRGRMTLQSLWNAQEGQICTCKSKMHRADASDPEVGSCSESSKLDEWSIAMQQVATSGPGCHEAEYPYKKWKRVECGEATAKHARIVDATRIAAIRGSGTWQVVSEGGQLSQVTGSFENVSGVTSITDSKAGADEWALQINSSYYETPLCDTGGPNCLGWQQFMYWNYSDTPGVSPSNQGAVNIWYWLIDYSHSPDATCPEKWTLFNNSGQIDCYFYTTYKYFSPMVEAKDLGKIQFTGVAKAGANDQVSFRSTDNKLHALTAPDSTVDLAQGWTRAEFNVYGAGDGSQAEFNANSSLDVKVAVPVSSGTIDCTNQYTTTTAESTNLTQGDECPMVPNASYPTFYFNQNNK